MTTVVFFCKTRDPWGELSNMYPCSLVGGGKEWASVEHLYQAQKFTDPGVREKIRQLASPMAAAFEGRNRAHTLRVDWEAIKEAKMLACLRLKYEQHPAIKAVLLSTGEQHIAELSYKDNYWGTRPDMLGQNRLGVLLMHLREQYRRFI